MVRNKDPVSETRSNVFACLIYPDGLEDAIRFIKSTMIRTAISPLHAPDPDPDTPGDMEKKPHYHCVMVADGVKSLKQAKELMPFALNGYVVLCHTKAGMLKYICHLNRPDKPRYDPSDVMELNGMDYYKESEDDTQYLLRLMEITEYIYKEHVTSLMKLQMYAMYNNIEWFRIISTRSTVYINALIKAEKDKDKKQ